MNKGLPDVQVGFRKGRGSTDQIANICWIIEKARELQKNIYFCFIDYTNAFNCVDHNKLWKILQETGIPNHLTCLLRNLHAGQEVPVRSGHGTTNRFKTGKGVSQDCIVWPTYWSSMQSSINFCSAAQSCLTLRPHGLPHTRLPYPSPSPGACSNSCPLSQWCHPIISSSVVPFSSCLQSFLASGSFLMSRLFASGGQSTGTSA